MEEFHLKVTGVLGRSFDACPDSVFFFVFQSSQLVMNPVKWRLCWLDDVGRLGQSLASDVTQS